MMWSVVSSTPQTLQATSPGQFLLCSCSEKNLDFQREFTLLDHHQPSIFHSREHQFPVKRSRRKKPGLLKGPSNSVTLLREGDSIHQLSQLFPLLYFCHTKVPSKGEIEVPRAQNLKNRPILLSTNLKEFRETVF